MDKVSREDQLAFIEEVIRANRGVYAQNPERVLQNVSYFVGFIFAGLLIMSILIFSATIEFAADDSKWTLGAITTAFAAVAFGLLIYIYQKRVEG
jgi:hypothetical protein